MLLNLSVAREVAYDGFVQVMQKKVKPEVFLEECYRKSKKPIKRIDRNMIKEMLYGSLRWYSKIFWILQNTSRRNLNETAPEIQAALVLGTYQIFYMDRVPDRAAVNESVEYVRKRGKGSATSFVNGILRQISRRAEYFAKPDKQKQPVDYLALQFAHPKWIVERWFKRFGFQKMEVMLSDNNQPAPTTIRINTIQTPLEQAHEFQQSLLKLERTHSERRPLRICLRCKEFPNLDEGSLFDQGKFTFQDEAAQLVPYLAAPTDGELIVDACAGPGGKLTQLFELSDGKATIIGIEKDEGQMLRMQENIDRLGHNSIELIQSDFLSWKPGTKVDKILIDAPCSGLGVLRRHPEGKWHKSFADIQKFQMLQKELMSSALKYIKPGGELIFSVCSFELEETTDQLKWLVSKYGDKIEVISPVSRLPDFYKKFVTRENTLLVYAGNNENMDGFGAFVVQVKEDITDE